MSDFEPPDPNKLRENPFGWVAPGCWKELVFMLASIAFAGWLMWALVSWFPFGGWGDK